jgi:transketolase
MDTSLVWIPASEFERMLGGITEPHDRCRAFATATRINTLYMITRAGSGHLGSSFSAADLVCWLLLEELREPFADDGDMFFSSKGHDVPGLYAALIGLGALPEPMVHKLRRLDGLPGHPDVHTPHMPFNTGSLGMGISKAKGVVLANRLRGASSRVYVLTGDGELQEGQNWEALAGAARHAMGELTVIVDHNKLQSDTWVRDVSDLGDLEAKFAAFGWAPLRCDGHDPAALAATFSLRHTEYPTQPAVIIADTEKGAGTSTFGAESVMADGRRWYPFHSGAPSAELYRRALDELVEVADTVLSAHGLWPLTLRPARVEAPAAHGGPRLPEVYGRELARLAERDRRVVALDADLLRDNGLVAFAEAYPERFVECGIAEQDMVSMAGGMAAGGLLPFVHSFSCFLHARPNEQIYNNATERRKIIYVGSLAGLLPAAPGHSHQAVRDVSALAAIPGLEILEPASPAEVRAAVDYASATTTSVYMRLVSAPLSERVAALDAEPLIAGHGRVIRDGGRIVAIGAGPIVLEQLLGAADLLHGNGIELTVVNLPWHNRVDPTWLRHLAERAEELFVVENQYTHGGQADLLSRALLEQRLPKAPRLRGIGLTEVPRCGTAEEALAAHGLSSAQLADAISAAVQPVARAA